MLEYNYVRDNVQSLKSACLQCLRYSNHKLSIKGIANYLTSEIPTQLLREMCFLQHEPKGHKRLLKAASASSETIEQKKQKQT